MQVPGEVVPAALPQVDSKDRAMRQRSDIHKVRSMGQADQVGLPPDSPPSITRRWPRMRDCSQASSSAWMRW